MNYNKNETIWVERYRPQRVQDLVLPKYMKDKFQIYANKQDIPNLLLSSSQPGTGKTSTAHALIKEINGEALFINASMENGIDLLRSKITKFASTTSFDGKIKIIVLDEADALQPAAQDAFRGVIEAFSDNCIFILTCNYAEKLMEPIRNRLETYNFDNLDKKEMVKPIFERLKAILENEKIEFNPKDLVPIINTFYPSIRSMIMSLQKFSTTGKLIIDENELDDSNKYLEIINLIKAKNFNEVINKINVLSNPSNIYTFMYKNIHLFPENLLPRLVVTIAKYQFQDASVRDKALNASACATEIMTLI